MDKRWCIATSCVESGTCEIGLCWIGGCAELPRAVSKRMQKRRVLDWLPVLYIIAPRRTTCVE